jgi:hypothetical protein
MSILYSDFVAETGVSLIEHCNFSASKQAKYRQKQIVRMDSSSANSTGANSGETKKCSNYGGTGKLTYGDITFKCGQCQTGREK